MFLLGLILILVLQFEGISGQSNRLYYRPAGQDAILPCGRGSDSPATCSEVSWFYGGVTSSYSRVVTNGMILSSPRAARLSLQTNCSLVIKNITAEDAGVYTCQQREDDYYTGGTYLSVLTISPYLPDADGEVTLECSLLRGNYLGSCEENSLRWLNETGSVLLGEGVGYEVFNQTDCVSHLKVKQQSGHNRRYTCQFVDQRNKVLIQGDYTPAFKGSTESPDPIDPAGWFPLSSVMLAVKIAGMIMIIVITVLLIRDAGALKEE